MAIEVIGQDEQASFQKTCRHCGAILKYYKNDVKLHRYVCMGHRDSDYRITCPRCKGDTVLKIGEY